MAITKKKNTTQNFGSVWVVWGKKITELKITKIVQTGILYPETPLMRYCIEGEEDLVIEKGEQSIRVGRRWFFLDRDLIKL